MIQTLIVVFLGRELDASSEQLGLLFFGIGLVQTAWFLAAPFVARRIGLLATMVVSHIPSNLCLIALPFGPSLSVAIALLVRAMLGQMDVPDPPGLRDGLGRPRRAHRRRGVHRHRPLHIARPFAHLTGQRPPPGHRPPGRRVRRRRNAYQRRCTTSSCGARSRRVPLPEDERPRAATGPTSRRRRVDIPGRTGTLAGMSAVRRALVLLLM